MCLCIGRRLCCLMLKHCLSDTRYLFSLLSLGVLTALTRFRYLFPQDALWFHDPSILGELTQAPITILSVNVPVSVLSIDLSGCFASWVEQGGSVFIYPLQYVLFIIVTVIFTHLDHVWSHGRTMLFRLLYFQPTATLELLRHHRSRLRKQVSYLRNIRTKLFYMAH